MPEPGLKSWKNKLLEAIQSFVQKCHLGQMLWHFEFYSFICFWFSEMHSVATRLFWCFNNLRKTIEKNVTIIKTTGDILLNYTWGPLSLLIWMESLLSNTQITPQEGNYLHLKQAISLPISPHKTPSASHLYTWQQPTKALGHFDDQYCKE